jgi:hypothetical protein
MWNVIGQRSANKNRGIMANIDLKLSSKDAAAMMRPAMVKRKYRSR